MKKNSIDLPSCTPSFSSVVSGISKGQTWFDNETDPRVAIAYSYCVGGYSILGVPITDAEMEEFLEGRVFSYLKKNDKKYFEFSTENEFFSEQVLRIYSGRDIKSELEYSFIKDDMLMNESSLHEDYLLEQITLKNVDRYMDYPMLRDRLENSWYSISDFLEISIGFVALREKEVIGICFGSAVYNNVIAVDIEVLKEHRKKGIAVNLAQKFINKAIMRNYTVHWDCTESNIASRKLAEKCGMKLVKSRPFYWFKV
jgi:RimJ/RimL family protein N-acetyltransferase